MQNMDNFLEYALFEGQFIPFKDAKLSIATHALHYGTGAFGGIRGVVDVENSKENESRVQIFRLDKHCKRLSDSARFLHYDLSPDYISEKIIEFIKINKPNFPFYIRPFIYTSDLGISPRLHNIKKDFLIYGIPMQDYVNPNGVSCRISSWTRQEDASIPLRGKISGAYITSSLAKTESHDSGFDEAILMNSKGKVCEASAMNLFIYRNNTLITPDLTQDILEGITRDSTISIARDLGITVQERPIDKSELYIADEVFLCGTAARITPVIRIENYILPEKRAVTNLLKKTLNDVYEDKDSKYSDWVTSIVI